jgi:hypothetical protein
MITPPDQPDMPVAINVMLSLVANSRQIRPTISPVNAETRIDDQNAIAENRFFVS